MNGPGPRPLPAPERLAFEDRLGPVHDRMRAAVRGSGGHLAPFYGWMRYHLGWSDPELSPVDARTAKGVRPWLCLVACEAVGGRSGDAVPFASAVELTHEFSLVHDDIQDHDRIRRGQAAVWTMVGAAQAINLGDALFALARRELGMAGLPAEAMLEAHRRYDSACVALAEGQFLDVAYEEQMPSVADYIAMVERKTGALLGAAAALGAISGGGRPDQIDGLEVFGVELGVAFQIKDDVLGLWGQPAVTGKAAGADLVRGKKTYPVLTAAALPGLAANLPPGRRDMDPREAAALAEAMDEAGVRAQAEAAAASRIDAALAALDGLDLRPSAVEALTALAWLAVERHR